MSKLTSPANFQEGGSVAVNTLIDRNNILDKFRKDGLKCYVRENQTTYQLRGGIDNINWIIVSIDPVYYDIRPPSYTDDETLGFVKNTWWIDESTRRAFLCVDPSEDQARWIDMSYIADQGGSNYVLGWGWPPPAYKFSWSNFSTIQEAIDAECYDIYCGGYFQEGIVFHNKTCGLFGNPFNTAIISRGSGDDEDTLTVTGNTDLVMFDITLQQRNSSRKCINWNAASSNIAEFRWINQYGNTPFGKLEWNAWPPPVGSVAAEFTDSAPNGMIIELKGITTNVWAETAFKFNSEATIQAGGIQLGSGGNSLIAFDSQHPNNQLFLNDIYLPYDISYGFREILRLNGGLANVANCVSETTRLNSFHITGNNAVLNLLNVALDPGSQTWDLLVDPAVTGAVFTVTSGKMDHTKLSYPAGTTVNGSFVSTNPGNEQVRFLGQNYVVGAPSGAGQWVAPIPTTIEEALNRLANEVFILKGGAIT